MTKFSEIKKIIEDKWWDFSWEVSYKWRRIRSFFRSIINNTYYRAKLGFNPADCWNLDHSFALYILPRLKYFKKTLDHYPGKLTAKQWIRELNKMILAFELITDDDKYIKFNDKNGKSEKLIEEGMISFAKYFRNLWS